MAAGISRSLQRSRHISEDVEDRRGRNWKIKINFGRAF